MQFAAVVVESNDAILTRRMVFVARTAISIFDSGAASRLWHFADSGITGENKIAGTQGSSFEIWSIGRENLPAGHGFSE